jgi:hypothetical protein
LGQDGEEGLSQWHFSEILVIAISADAAAMRLGICVGSAHKLIRKGILPATQLMQSASWQNQVAAFDRPSTAPD